MLAKTNFCDKKNEAFIIAYSVARIMFPIFIVLSKESLSNATFWVNSNVSLVQIRMLNMGHLHLNGGVCNIELTCHPFYCSLKDGLTVCMIVD